MYFKVCNVIQSQLRNSNNNPLNGSYRSKHWVFYGLCSNCALLCQAESIASHRKMEAESTASCRGMEAGCSCCWDIWIQSGCCSGGMQWKWDNSYHTAQPGTLKQIMKGNYDCHVPLPSFVEDRRTWSPSESFCDLFVTSNHNTCKVTNIALGN